LKEALKTDRARIQVGRISRFGLLEMSRQRLRLSLGESAQEVCPRCEGRGTVRNIQSHGLAITRLIEEEALKEKTAEVQVQLPVELATFIINEKREFVLNIEKRHSVHVLIIANPYLQTPQYYITRLREDNIGKNKKASYTLIQQPDLVVPRATPVPVKVDEPAVKPLLQPAKTQPNGFMKRLWNSLFGNNVITEAKISSTAEEKAARSSSRQSKQASQSTGGEKRQQNQPKRRRPTSGSPHQQQRGTANASSRKKGQAGQQPGGRAGQVKKKEAAVSAVKEASEDKT
jgi:ribonuclease E